MLPDDLSHHFFHWLIPGRRLYDLVIPFCAEGFDETRVNYGENDTTKIGIRSSIGSPLKHSLALLPFTIHAGYCHILLNFEEQIRLGQEEQNTDFHSVYLMKILDGFAMDLLQRENHEDPAKYRCRFLNPILQRYLRETPDDDPAQLAKNFGSATPVIEDYYHALDPLDPQQIGKLHQKLASFGPTHSDESREGLEGSHSAYSDQVYGWLACLNPPDDEDVDEELAGLNPSDDEDVDEELAGLNPPDDEDVDEVLAGLNPPDDEDVDEELAGLNPPDGEDVHEVLAGLNPPDDENAHEVLAGLNPLDDENLYEVLACYSPTTREGMLEWLAGTDGERLCEESMDLNPTYPDEYGEWLAYFDPTNTDELCGGLAGSNPTYKAKLPEVLASSDREISVSSGYS